MHRIIDIQISIGNQAYLYIGKKGTPKAYASEFSLPQFSCIFFILGNVSNTFHQVFSGCQRKKNPLNGRGNFLQLHIFAMPRIPWQHGKVNDFLHRHFSIVWCTTSLRRREKLNYFSSSLAENQFFMGVAFLQCGMAAPQILIPALHKCIRSVHSNFQYEVLSYAYNLFFFAHLAVDRLILLLQILCPL